ncbi:hypothetical protein JD844_028892, partial [Phrynosoma platyrhinos]
VLLLFKQPLRGKNPVDLITVDSLIELQDFQNPFQYWIVSVLDNVGGRLRLRYVGLEETESYDQWLFYLDYRLRPVGWCQENKYRLDPPAEIYSLKTVPEWQAALDKSLIEAAKFPLPVEVFKDHADLRNHQFTVGMKLEAVDINEPCRICPATVTKYKGREKLLSYNPKSKGEWEVGEKKQFKVRMEEEPETVCIIPAGTINGRYSCPALFINHRCFSGPHLNKGRLAELPQSVGPGKCVLVLKEVLSMVINSAYRPGSVLRELQLVEDPRWNFQEETLKAKYRGKTYRATVKIVRTSDQVLDFCRRVCNKLECCPNLFSPLPVTEACPENCSIHTKTKYNYYDGRRRKIIKPPASGKGNLRSLVNRHGKPARRRKRRKLILAHRKRRLSTTDLNPTESAEESDEEESEVLDDETWSEETSPDLHVDQMETSSVDLPSTKSTISMKLRSSVDMNRVARSERGRRAQKALSLLRAKGEKRARLKQEIKKEPDEKLILESNPLGWTVSDVVRFIKLTDCAPLAKIFQEQDIDGQALLLLTLPTVQECMDLKLGPAIKLCHQIERVKLAFYDQYAN